MTGAIWQMIKKHILLSLIPIILFGFQHNRNLDVLSATFSSSSYEEAKNNSLEDLSDQILVTVWSSTSSDISETSRGIEEKYSKVIKTHSAAILRNVNINKLVLPNGLIQVTASIKRAEIEKIFNERRQLIVEMCSNAEKNLNNINLGQALKNFYYAAVLIKSLPEHSFISQGINYTTQIPRQINDILRNIEIVYHAAPASEDEIRNIKVEAHYKSIPVSLMEFTIWDGYQNVEVGVKNGIGSFQLLGASVMFKSVRTSITYSYPDNIREYSIVEQLWDIVNKPIFNAEIVIPVLEQSLKILDPITFQNYTGMKLIIKTELENAPIKQISDEATSLLKAFAREDDPFLKDHYLSNKIDRYLKFNHPTAIQEEYEATINKIHSGFELRSLPIQHNYPSLSKQTTEFIVLDFDSTGTLSDFNTAIPDVQYKEFLQQSGYANDWQNRQQIIKFLERFRTSYLTRDISTLELMYAEGALIITGKILKRVLSSSDGSIDFQRFDDQPDVEYLKLSKSEYLNRLKYIFNSKPDLFVNFSTLNMVTKNNAPGVYGIEMRQSYSTTTYADEGYLFLLVDFEQLSPTIYVRAWQPNEWNPDQLIRASNYRVYK